MYTYIAMKSNLKKGFTLIETLVSLGIFSIVVVTATGVILSIITASKRNQSINSVVNNLNYSIDSMIRDISTGYRFRCDYDDSETHRVGDFKLLPASTCGSGKKNNITLISTITGQEQIVKYEFVEPTGGIGYIQKTIYTEKNPPNVEHVTYALTDQKNIDIDDMGFTITNPPTLISDLKAGQPSVFVIIKGSAQVNQINISDFFIQTFVSQRLPNLI